MSNPERNSLKFSKCIVVSCIAFIVFYTLLQIYLNYTLSVEVSPTLTTCVFAFFGTELASTALIRVFDKEDSRSSEENREAKG